MNDHLSDPGGKVRLYAEAPLAPGARVEASEGQTHYLFHVMRARAGERVSLFNSRDGEWLATIAEAGKRRCAFICTRQVRPQHSGPDVWLCFAPIKKMPADYLTQKATELGVSVLQPVITQRTIVSRVNTARMRANAVEAAEQSDRLDVPEIREPVTLEHLLANWPKDRRLLFCDEAGEAPPIAAALQMQPPPPLAGGGEPPPNPRKRNRLEQLVRFGGGSGEGVSAASPVPQSSHAANARIAPSRKGRGQSYPWAVLTGPEGGFDQDERATIRGHSFVVPASLGPRILRADTAGLAALAVWQALRGDWR